MNQSRFRLPIVVVIACSATWIVRQALVAEEKPVAPASTPWEYKMLPGDQVAELGENGVREGGVNPIPGELYRRAQESGLDKLGTKGWELVAVESTGSTSFTYFFKRRKLAK